MRISLLVLYPLYHINGIVQNYIISIANALDIRKDMFMPHGECHVLVSLVARACAGMVLISLSRNIPGLALIESMITILNSIFQMLHVRVEHYFWTIPSFEISIKRVYIFVKHDGYIHCQTILKICFEFTFIRLRSYVIHLLFSPSNL